MNRIKFCLLLFITGLCIITTPIFQANAEDSQYYENWGWNYDNGTLKIFGENATPDINPLENLAGKEEENLPYYYKYFSEITSLVIENDIKEIGDYGFCDLDYLESITLPNSLVTIGEQSFSSTGVTEITIPKCVQTIEKGAFIGCWQLKLAYVMCRDVDIQEYALGYKTDFSNDKYEDFIIYGYADSTAETYANENGFTFIALDEQPTTETVEGDVNNDGTFTIADVVLLQKWILTKPDATLKNWKAGDLCEDNIINVFDLCLMKQNIIDKIK
ncbi:MAG: leucine-rich repeat protein [Oscillospiraceae bacterium]|nr:leucine-rich repeat protein [Oscillospiraceae bacterium]